MGKVIAIEHVTLDGVMQAPARADEDARDGFEHGGWGASGGNDPALQQELGARMGTAWALLAGRVTYEDFASVWPQRAGNPMADALTRVQKYVASTTLHEPLTWQNSTLLQGDVPDAVAKLKAERPDNLVIFGSGVLVRSLMRRGLVDEFVLQIHPIVLGSGRRLFEDGSALTHLRLVRSLTAESGVIVATYEVLPEGLEEPNLRL